MIYHIDDTIGNVGDNNLQINATHPRSRPVASCDTFTQDATFPDWDADATTVYPGATRNTALGNTTTPNNDSYSGVPTNVLISNITVQDPDVYADLDTLAISISKPQNSETVFALDPTLLANAAGVEVTGGHAQWHTDHRRYESEHRR